MSRICGGTDNADAGESYFRGQVVYLDADGAQDVTYQGPVTDTNINVPTLQASDRFAMFQ